jgi:pimeloyl-ACP methyl ester carboxylesterase
MSTGEEIRLESPSGPLAGLRWAAPGGAPVLCLHGWLDNAASFMPLSRLLSGLDLVALDFPGHGHSGHRHPTAHYYFTEYLFDLDAALDALGWDSCHLLGHSLGAAVSSLYASSAAERVRSLVMLDALGPLVARPEGTAERLRKSMDSVRAGPRRMKPYASIDDMVRARRANSDLGEEAARLICERSAQQRGSQYEWRNNPALYWVSPLLMTEEQARDCLRHIQAPVLTLTAQPFAAFLSEELYAARCAAMASGQHMLVEGDHHFHMDQPERVAATIQSFILAQDQSHGKTHANNHSANQEHPR